MAGPKKNPKTGRPPFKLTPTYYNPSNSLPTPTLYTLQKAVLYSNAIQGNTTQLNATQYWIRSVRAKQSIDNHQCAIQLLVAVQG